MLRQHVLCPLGISPTLREDLKQKQPTSSLAFMWHHSEHSLRPSVVQKILLDHFWPAAVITGNHCASCSLSHYSLFCVRKFCFLRGMPLSEPQLDPEVLQCSVAHNIPGKRHLTLCPWFSRFSHSAIYRFSNISTLLQE